MCTSIWGIPPRLPLHSMAEENNFDVLIIHWICRVKGLLDLDLDAVPFSSLAFVSKCTFLHSITLEFRMSESRNFGISELCNGLQFHLFVYSIQCETSVDRRTCHVLTALSVSSEKYSDSRSSSPQWNPNARNATLTCQQRGSIRWCNRKD